MHLFWALAAAGIQHLIAYSCVALRLNRGPMLKRHSIGAEVNDVLLRAIARYVCGAAAKTAFGDRWNRTSTKSPSFSCSKTWAQCPLIIITVSPEVHPVTSKNGCGVNNRSNYFHTLLTIAVWNESKCWWKHIYLLRSHPRCLRSRSTTERRRLQSLYRDSNQSITVPSQSISYTGLSNYSEFGYSRR